jgi:PEP-CTERM motif
MAAGLSSFAGNAKAQSPLTWNFNAIGSDFSLSGTITGTSNGDGTYKAISGAATFGTGYFAGDVATLTSIPNTNSVYVWGANWWTGDKILPNTTLLDTNGINFDFSDNGQDTWMFLGLLTSVPSNSYSAMVKYNDGTAFGAPNISSDLVPLNNNLVGETNVSFTLTQSVPEPSTYALFGIGAIGLLMVLRRKKTS